jgi:hypothetical protein
LPEASSGSPTLFKRAIPTAAILVI